MSQETHTSVVVHTYNRPDWLESDVAAGRWAGIPLFIIDDASRPTVQERLRQVAAVAGGGFAARPENGGVALAARDGAAQCGTPTFMLCGDDDYLTGFQDFALEAERLLQRKDVLLVAMPEVKTIEAGKSPFVQYDRRILDGMTGRELLHDLVHSAEMRALQAGSMLRTPDALPLFAESIFRTSEDYILIARLCAAHPDRVIRVPDAGAYCRRIHKRSLSHASRGSVARSTLNLVAHAVAGRLLGTPTDALRGLIRQRGAVLATVYGFGSGASRVVEALLSHSRPVATGDEEREALAYLRSVRSELPAELRDWHDLLDADGPPVTAATPESLLTAAADSLDAREIDDARRSVASYDGPESAALDVIRARLAWEDEDPNASVRHLSTALVRQPEHEQALDLLAQIAEAADMDAVATRLRNRLAGVRPKRGEDIRVAFIVSKGLDQFVNDLVRDLLPLVDARKFVVESQADLEEAMSWADVCWFEWCNEPVMWASRQDAARSKPIICRMHRYEAFTDMPLKVNWDRVDALVVVADHIGEIACELVPGLRSHTRIVHIPNGVDMARYVLTERAPGFDIALVGYLHGRKNPGLALQIMAELVAVDPRYRLHVAGTFQDQALRLYWHSAVKAMGLTENVILHAWQEDMAAFLSDKQYLLSTSTHESFGYAIAEAMASGIKPVVLRFPFADDMWPGEILFNTVREAVAMVRSASYDSHAYRAFVSDHYRLELQIDSTRQLIEALAPGQSEILPVADILKLTPKVVNASVSCRCPRCRTEVELQVQSIAGCPVGLERCPSCSAVLSIPDQVYEAALARFEHSMAGSPGEVHRALRMVATGLGKHPLWHDAFEVDGLNLIEGMEFELTKELAAAWLSIPEVSAA